MIDTHTHLDGEEFNDDLAEVIRRAKSSGVEKAFIPAIDLSSSRRILEICRQYSDYCHPIIGIHPEEVKDNWEEQLNGIKALLSADVIGIGEVGLDYYWSREFEKEQLECFERQVVWSVETRLPLMIHCRKAQNEMVKLLRRYESELPGGVFHCFTGNEHEAVELLEFEKFVLGIGGVLTFKKSNLPQTLPAVVPLSRIVLETDSPYMAPVPYRGKRNEPSFIPMVCSRLADAYGVSGDEVDRITTDTARRIFNV
ncbi:MAG: TatD family hydrolase [Bacteroidales bacterium]|nr:TatD family hydrolase [Bacteroidales bacterium]MCM1147437.1 TatD family hydrolase [Bacteroidales bacterium]MCM1206106.1 TatD family hydrolase [Bacillota bacterium]MCM1510063.1 TatD family hydrolase [Clostridium sp.]